MSTQIKPILLDRPMMDPDTNTIADDTVTTGKPLVSLVIPAYNEAASFKKTWACCATT